MKVGLQPTTVRVSHLLIKGLIFLLCAIILLIWTPTESPAGNEAYQDAPRESQAFSSPEPAVDPRGREADYSVTVVEKAENGRLVLDCVLDKARYSSDIHLLGNTIYTQNHGNEYEQVIINWHLKNRGSSELPWAQTNMAGKRPDLE